MITVIIVAAAVAALLLILLALAAISYKIAFGARCDKNALLKYFSAEELNISAEPFSVSRKKRTLRGFIYRKEGTKDNGKLIIFCHGMGPGQIAYTTEIAYFCGEGFTVLALDSLGCNLSDGKNIRGMYEGVITAKAAIDFARSDARLKDRKIYLVGHSWGAYSVLVAASERKVDGVVALSSPLTPVKTISYGAVPYIGKPLAAILQPFWYVIDFFRFGKHANKNAAKCAEKSGTKVLLIHSDNDTIVPDKKSAYLYAKGGNIKKYLAVGKNHNPYLSAEAQKLVSELFGKLPAVKKMSENERTAYFSGLDYKAASEDDEEVMSEITRFMQN